MLNSFYYSALVKLPINQTWMWATYNKKQLQEVSRSGVDSWVNERRDSLRRTGAIDLSQFESRVVVCLRVVQ